MSESRGVARLSGMTPDPVGLFDDAGLSRSPDQVLRLGGLALEAVARDIGTPTYVYNAGSIRTRYRALTEAFGATRHRIHYAVKANSNLAVLKILRDLGAGADIVSAGELTRVLAAGFDPADVVFSGVGKSEAELAAAMAANVGAINLESGDELVGLERLLAGRSLERPIRVGIRVNPDVGADTHPYITTGAGGMKFGVPSEQVAAVAARIAGNPRLKLVSLAMHLGSQLLDPGPLVAGTQKLVGLLDQLRLSGIGSVEAVDIGGGLGIRYHDETALDPGLLAGRIAPLVGGLGVALHLEPGRYLTGSAGVLLTKVLYRKHSGGKDFVIVDAAMNDLVRPSHYDAYHSIVELNARGRPEQVVDVVGPVCETGDFLARDRPLPEVLPGEYLAILCAGAYGFVMASNYNTRLLPAEVMVDRNRYAVSRKRQTIEAILAGESADPFQ